MKRLSMAAAVIVAAALTASSPGVAGWFDGGVRGSGNIVTEARTVPEFDRVSAGGSQTVIVTVGPARSVTIKADDNVVPLIETTVENGKLHIGSKKSYSSADVTVTVTVPALKGVSLAGSGDVTVSGVEGGSLGAALSGSGDITVSGKADSVSVSVSGSGEIHLFDLAARTADVSIAGSGDVEVNASDTLSVSIAGSGDITYRGKPQVKRSIAGSGDVRPASET